jgi:hypothetical protein
LSGLLVILSTDVFIWPVEIFISKISMFFLIFFLNLSLHWISCPSLELTFSLLCSSICLSLLWSHWSLLN